MKHLLFLFLLPLCLTISAQDTLSAKFVDTPPLLKAEDIPQADEDSDQNRLFLEDIYSSIKYPRYARENGVRAVVGVNYLVGIEGEISIEKTKVFTDEEVSRLRVPKEELITITAFSTTYVNGRPGAVVSSPRQTKNEKRLVKAHRALEEAAAASIRSLPTFVPASHEGSPVVVRFSRIFVFRME